MHAFTETCQRHALKITPQRVAVYRALLASGQHPTTDAMFQTVKQTYPHISFDTVNRTLLTFADIGLVDVVEVFGGPKRFDPDRNAHHHLHCVACGRIIDFAHEDYNRLDVPDTIAARFKVLSKRVVLKGVCDTCTRVHP
jgi:Fur family peroxide stress response transcriptional regulator